MSGDPATTPPNGEHLVRHRKRRRHSFRPESEALARRRQDLRALAWILPGCMLALGATSFWETIDGGDAFSKAGSLCHGWSAVPVYFWHKYAAYRPAAGRDEYGKPV